MPYKPYKPAAQDADIVSPLTSGNDKIASPKAAGVEFLGVLGLEVGVYGI